MYQLSKYLVYKGLVPLIQLWKKLIWRVYLLTHHEIKIIVGAGQTRYKGWFATDIVTLDVTNEKHFKKYFKKKRINKVLAEHVLEHLTKNELALMIENFKKYSAKDFNIRIAVPDGLHKEETYINSVKPGGTGDGAADHKHLFNYKTLARLFKDRNFKPNFVEYWDEDGIFHQGYSNDENGYVKRSFINDSRNSDGIPRYTSLIVDFRKVEN
jgi:predicted SAM-dependent methyltransferase